MSPQDVTANYESRGTILYISYDGMLEPLGQSQVLAYLKKLAAERPIHLISFEKAEDWESIKQRSLIQQDIANSGIHWHPLRYHKHPSSIATAWDILQGCMVGVWVALRYRCKIVHARSYVAAVMALVVKRLTGAKFIFDMRGFWADERVDGGIWPANSKMYRISKYFERQFLLHADHVVSLTHAAVRVMKQFPYLKETTTSFSVIPTCADLAKFTPAESTARERRERPFTLGYVGSAGTWYLFGQVCQAMVALLKINPQAQFLLVNKGEHELIREELANAGIPAESFSIITANHSEVPHLINQMDAGIFFIKPAYSKQASAPTKLAEFLGCGVPCLSNSGVGDMAEVLESEGVGISISNFQEDTLENALAKLIKLVANPHTESLCVSAAHKHFSLDEGVRRYSQIYLQLDKQL